MQPDPKRRRLHEEGGFGSSSVGVVVLGAGRGRAFAWVAAVAAGGLLLAGCSSDGGGGGSSDDTRPAGASKPSQAATPAAQIQVLPANGAAGARPDKPVTVKVVGGRLTQVTLTAADGRAIPGKISADGLTWTSSGTLFPDTRYTVAASAKNKDDKSATTSSAFTTLKPKKTVSTTVTPSEGWTVGVGMPVIVNFSRPVKDRAAALKGLTVTATPATDGGWRWFSSSQVQWRPKQYWASGTKVTVTSALRNVEVSPGVWGKSTRTTSFQVGSAMISTVDINRHTLTVRRNGKVLRVIPVTTGKQGFNTRKGVKVIMSRESTRRMDAETTGIKKDDPEYYDVKVKWAMRLTNTGEFFHAAPWSVGSQGRANVSHGCTGMSTANADWFYHQSKVGDVAIFTGSKRTLEWGNGYTAWDMSYDRWLSGG
jgi:lipoprotein-anchoring transpeptidase ErfK/SrfK